MSKERIVAENGPVQRRFAAVQGRMNWREGRNAGAFEKDGEGAAERSGRGKTEAPFLLCTLFGVCEKIARRFDAKRFEWYRRMKIFSASVIQKPEKKTREFAVDGTAQIERILSGLAWK